MPAAEPRRLLLATLALLVSAAAPASALVHLDKGRVSVDGVQLLQDYYDPKVYYYLPQFPRLASREDGSLEFVCLKYVDSRGGASGGLFHALVQLSLPPAAEEALLKRLREQVPGARLAGPVPLMEAGKDGEEGVGSFQLVSAVLRPEKEGGLARQVVTSGKAPLLPGAKAVVAALLNQQGATLLWDTLNGSTSDVSVSVHGVYEAAVEGYNARVFAEMSTVYEHFSRVLNRQQGYQRRQVRQIVDELQRSGTLKVEVLDRTSALGIEAKDMEGILQVVTDKLTELMFDHAGGWAAEPEREVAVESGQIRDRLERSWLARTFGGTDDTPYYTDDQYVLKDRKDIRTNTFSLVLSKQTTLRVPFDTAGNLSAFYAARKEDPRYFRVVDLDDPTFELRTVHFQIDGDFVDAFKDTVNFVSVNVRKRRGDHPAFTRSLHFSASDVAAGKVIQEVVFPRLGEAGADWTEHEYQVRWSLRGRGVVSVPAGDSWIRTRDAAVSLTPPFRKRVVEIEADRKLFLERGLASAVVEFASVLGGEPRVERKAVLRPSDGEPAQRVAVYHDAGKPVAVRVSWKAPRGSADEPLAALTSDYLYLTPPAMPGPEGGGVR